MAEVNASLRRVSVMHDNSRLDLPGLDCLASVLSDLQNAIEIATRVPPQWQRILFAGSHYANSKANPNANLNPNPNPLQTQVATLQQMVTSQEPLRLSAWAPMDCVQ